MSYDGSVYRPGRRVLTFFLKKKSPKHKHYHYSKHNSYVESANRIPISYGSLTLLIVIFIF